MLNGKTHATTAILCAVATQAAGAQDPNSVPQTASSALSLYYFLPAVLLITTIVLFSLYQVHSFLQNATLHDERRHRIVVALLSLVVTALGILLGLMPRVQEAIAYGSGTIGVVTFNISGPAVIWLISFLFLVRFLPVLEQRNGSRSQEIREAESRMGFKTYDKWRSSLDDCREIVLRNEMHFILDLFPNVFYHGNDEVDRPRNPQIHTLFVFSGNKAVKFQVIIGDRRRDGKPIELFLPMTTSTASGKAESLFFVKKNDDITKVIQTQEGNWHTFDSARVEGLLVAIYEGDVIPDGDYVYLDVTKYLQIGEGESAEISFALCVDRTLSDVQVWELAASLDHMRAPVPLIFRSLDARQGQEMISKADLNADIAAVYEPWLSLLDSINDSKLKSIAIEGVTDKAAGVLGFLTNVRTIASKSKTQFVDFYKDEKYTGGHFFRRKKQSNVVLSMFRWPKGT